MSAELNEGGGTGGNYSSWKFNLAWDTKKFIKYNNNSI